MYLLVSETVATSGGVPSTPALSFSETLTNNIGRFSGLCVLRLYDTIWPGVSNRSVCWEGGRCPLRSAAHWPWGRQVSLHKGRGGVVGWAPEPTLLTVRMSDQKSKEFGSWTEMTRRWPRLVLTPAVPPYQIAAAFAGWARKLSWWGRVAGPHPPSPTPTPLPLGGYPVSHFNPRGLCGVCPTRSRHSNAPSPPLPQ